MFNLLVCLNASFSLVIFPDFLTLGFSEAIWTMYVLSQHKCSLVERNRLEIKSAKVRTTSLASRILARGQKLSKVKLHFQRLQSV